MVRTTEAGVAGTTEAEAVARMEAGVAGTTEAGAAGTTEVEAVARTAAAAAGHTEGAPNSFASEHTHDGPPANRRS